MSRVPQNTPEKATPEIEQIYEEFKKKMGRIPNIFLHMGHSAVALRGYLAQQELAGKTSIPPKLREEIALVVAEVNKCHYCLSAHSAIAKMQGLNAQQINFARKGESANSKESAILQFAKKIVEKRGDLSEADVDTLKKNGVTDQEIVDVIFLVSINIFTNYFNLVVDPEVDFPEPAKLS
ncbi:MAG: carboxymuconolactone decarboxylase family protein [Anaerolineae bacterium]